LSSNSNRKSWKSEPLKGVGQVGGDAYECVLSEQVATVFIDVEHRHEPRKFVAVVSESEYVTFPKFRVGILDVADGSILTRPMAAEREGRASAEHAHRLSHLRGKPRGDVGPHLAHFLDAHLKPEFLSEAAAQVAL
jgi:hypothetical protein